MIGHKFLGAIFGEENPANTESSDNDVTSQFCSFSGQSQPKLAKKQSLTPCPQCKATGCFECAACGQLKTVCNRCGYEHVKFKQSLNGLPANLLNASAIDLVDWKGEDILANDDGIFVTGAVISKFIELGFSAFSFGPVHCEIGNIAPELTKKVELSSRKFFDA